MDLSKASDTVAWTTSTSQVNDVTRIAATHVYQVYTYNHLLSGEWVFPWDYCRFTNMAYST